MRTFTGVDIVFRLLNGTLSGAQLEAALTTDAALYLGPWIEVLKAVELNALINSPTALTAMFGSSTALSNLFDIAGAELAASDTATELISNTSSAILTVVTTPAYLDYWNNTPANKARLQARINASGSKLKRQEWTSSGTWTAPGTPIVALSVFAVGGGGNGGNGNPNISGLVRGGGGGSGGEAAATSITTGLPASNQSVTVGAAESVSEFGALLTAAAGVVGPVGTDGAAAGGGTDSGSIYDTAPSTAIWQYTASKQGGSGGSSVGANASYDGFAGTAGLTGAGGAGGTMGGGTALGGAGGTGFCSGGGSGAIIAPGGASTTSGSSASANTGCGGGGGGASASGASNGSAGGSGLVVAYWVEA